MSASIENQYPRPRPGPWSAVPVPGPLLRRGRGSASVRRFYHVSLATVLSTMVVVGDRMVDAWTSGGLLLALVVLWLAVFMGLSLFSRLLERFALRVMVSRARCRAS